jgi:hypothetical protein
MANGLSFNQAYNKISQQYGKKDISKIKRNFYFLINYKSLITKGLVYLSLTIFIISWIFRFGYADWLGLTAFILLGLVILRYSIILNNDHQLKRNKTIVLLLTITFSIFLTGSAYRFMWLNYGYINKHIMPLLLISWVIFSIATLLYYNGLEFNSNRKLFTFYKTVAWIQVLLSFYSISTLFIKPLLNYIQQASGIILAANIISFIVISFKKQSGKY